ncbi:hypothetical protein [Corynebacterium sp. SA-MJD20WY100]|uniref:hypothetical protein n=1 Tax=Corynebacterium sp. SA-MJD20WY100 TaxID=3142969 RepID=UPI003221D3A3
MTLGALTTDGGAKPDTFDDFSATDIADRAQETALALKQIADFFEQAGRSNRDDVVGLFDQDWLDCADRLHSLAETLTAMSDTAEG